MPVSLAMGQGDGQVIGHAQVQEMIKGMRQAYAQVRDYTAVFHKKCVLPDDECPDEQAKVKFSKPFAMYMKWTGPVNPDQEMIYVQGRNQGKIMGHPGSFPDITMSVDPDSSLAMRCNRRTIAQSGIGRMIDITGDVLTKNPQAIVRREPDQNIYGKPCHCFSIQRSTCGVDLDNCWLKAKLCTGADDQLPRQASFWDERGELIEQYGYSELKTNVGLTDADFDPDNKEYDF